MGRFQAEEPQDGDETGAIPPIVATGQANGLPLMPFLAAVHTPRSSLYTPIKRPMGLRRYPAGAFLPVEAVFPVMAVSRGCGVGAVCGPPLQQTSASNAFSRTRYFSRKGSTVSQRHASEGGNPVQAHMAP